MPASLNGLRVLLLEDEVLIAMDVEQLCLDNGAATVKTVRDLVETEAANPALFDIAIVDLRLGGQSTLVSRGDLMRWTYPSSSRQGTRT